MAYNLVRNSRIFVTTNLSTASGQNVIGAAGTSSGVGEILKTGFDTDNFWEIQVLDGFTFSQNTENTTIQINEAGSTPIRGQRSFNTALSPAELSFSTYIRPKSSGTEVTAEEKYLWNALVGAVGIVGTDDLGSLVTATPLSGTPAGTLVRSTTNSPVFTITGTATMSTFAINSVYNLSGLTGSAAPNYNKPFKVVSSSTTTLVGEYLTAPPASAGVTVANVTVSAAATLSTSGWVSHPTASGITTPYGEVTTAHSNKNTLQRIGFLINVDSSWYAINNCVVDQASIDFGLDSIATIAWTVQGALLKDLGTDVTVTNNTLTSATIITGNAVFAAKTTDAQYITNKLSTVSMKSTLGGVGSGNSTYTLALTGGNITIANNVSYITPANLGVVNIPVGYFTGSRSVSGTLNAYLRTGSGQAADLLADLLDNISTSAETKFKLQVEVGGLANSTRVEFEIPGASLGIPSVEVQDVISTAITFNAQGTDKDLNGVASADYDLENTNDLYIRYFAA